MKVTSKTRVVRAWVRDYFETEVSLEYYPDSRDPIPRVVVFPKVWREGGKQYKVTACTYNHPGNYGDKVTIRVPRGSDGRGFGCDGTIEYY